MSNKYLAYDEVFLLSASSRKAGPIMKGTPLNILHCSSYSKKTIYAFYPFQLVSFSPLLQITAINYAPTAKPPCKEDSSSSTAAKEGLLDFFGKGKHSSTLKGAFSFGERS